MTNKPDTLPEGRGGAGRLEELAARVEALSGADREIGREVLRACGWTQAAVGYFMGPLTIWRSPNGSTRFDDDDFARHDPTASMDAAMQLIDGDTFFHLSRFSPESEPRAEAHIYPNRWLGDDYEAHGATPALALCAVALRAQSLLNQEKPK